MGLRSGTVKVWGVSGCGMNVNKFTYVYEEPLNFGCRHFNECMLHTLAELFTTEIVRSFSVGEILKKCAALT